MDQLTTVVVWLAYVACAGALVTSCILLWDVLRRHKA